MSDIKDLRNFRFYGVSLVAGSIIQKGTVSDKIKTSERAGSGTTNTMIGSGITMKGSEITMKGSGIMMKGSGITIKGSVTMKHTRTKSRS